MDQADTVLSNLAIEIAACRISRGWDQAQLAEELGVSTKTISNWEDGKKIPRPQHTLALREVFDIEENRMRDLVRSALNFRAGNFENYSIQNWRFAKENFDSDVAFLRRLVEIDMDVLEYVNDQVEGTAEQWTPIFMHHKETWRLLVHEEKVVGYWHFVPLKQEVFIQLMEGRMIEADLSLSSTVPIIGPGNYNVFVAMVAVDPDHRIRGSTMLELNLVRTIRKFAASGIYLSGMAACVLSLDGLAMCQKLGMESICRYQYADEHEIAQIFATDGKRISEKGMLSEVYEIRKRYTQRFRTHDWLAKYGPAAPEA